jgi:hypothetical protein
MPARAERYRSRYESLRDRERGLLIANSLITADSTNVASINFFMDLILQKHLEFHPNEFFIGCRNIWTHFCTVVLMVANAFKNLTILQES